jgi:hypothetical protein
MRLGDTRLCVAMGSVLALASAAAFMAGDGEAGVSPARAAGSAPAAVGVPGTDQPAWTTARRDRVVVRDDGVNELYALDGMLLYGRVDLLGPDGTKEATTRRWMRVVNGRQLAVGGMPTGSQPFSIGRDATGRVVVVLGRSGSDGVEAWWLYDIARDAARRLRVPPEKSCVIRNVAVWRGRMAQAVECPPSRLEKWRVVVREGASTMRVTRTNAGFGVSTLVLRNRSLAVIVVGGRREQTLWRILDRGRRCPKAVAGTIDENGFWAGLGSGTLTWAIAGFTFESNAYDLLAVRDVDLAGRCQAAPRKRHTAPSLLPQTPIHGSRGSGPAIDGRKFYYATDTAIHMLRLPTRRAAAASRQGGHSNLGTPSIPRRH